MKLTPEEIAVVSNTLFILWLEGGETEQTEALRERIRIEMLEQGIDEGDRVIPQPYEGKHAIA